MPEIQNELEYQEQIKYRWFVPHHDKQNPKQKVQNPKEDSFYP